MPSIISLFFAPALSAVIPALVDEQHLVAANSLHSLSESLMRFIGPPLGGALLALVGLRGVVLVDTISFLLSASMILLITIPHNRLAIRTLNAVAHDGFRFGVNGWKGRDWCESAGF